MATNVSTQPKKSNIGVRERGIEPLDENYSARLLNFVDSNRINGVDYTRFYTQFDTNLKVGDNVYIVNGNYDTYDIIKQNPYRDGANGYKILEINRCAITIDVQFDGTLPWNEDNFDDYIKIWVSNTSQELNWEINQNAYYPYKYIYGFRANNNILFDQQSNTMYVADPYNDISDISGWTDITTDFFNNNFPTLGTASNPLEFTDNNGKMVPMQEFTYNNTTFRKGYVYKYKSGEWIIDNKSRQAYISLGSFRQGRFKSIWNDGIFGQIDERIDWTGATWLNGVFFNSNWKSGVMQSKSDSITRQSFYAEIDENGEIKQTTDFNNNSGFGYNVIDDSIFESIQINNANAKNCIFGSYSATQSVLSRYLLSPTQSDSDYNFNIKLNNGRYLESLIEDALLNGGSYEWNAMNNVKSLDGDFIQSNISYSVLEGNYEGIGNTKILHSVRALTSTFSLYENPYEDNIISLTNSSSYLSNYKFYIEEKDFLRFKYDDDISLSDFVTSNQDILNFFDNKFYLGVNKDGELYTTDNYGQTSSIIVQLKSKEQNKLTKNLPQPSQLPATFSTTDSIYEFNLQDYPSIDIFVKESVVNYSIIDDSETTLQRNKLTKSIFKGGNWLANKINNPDFIIKRLGEVFSSGDIILSGHYLDMSLTASQLQINLNDVTGICVEDTILIDDVVFLDNISYITSTQSYHIDGVYQVATYSCDPLSVTLQDFATQSIIPSLPAGGTFATTFAEDDIEGVVQDKFNSIHFERIESTNLRRGLIKRELLQSDIIENNDLIEYYQQSSESFKNGQFDNRILNKLKLSELILNASNDLDIQGGSLVRSFIRQTNIENSIIRDSVLRNNNLRSGVVSKSRWISGTVSGGRFQGALKDIISSAEELSNMLGGDFSNFTTIQTLSEWNNGVYIGGEFYNSIWDTGTFSNGKFYNSIFSAGVWENGVFGDTQFSNQDTKFGHPIWSHNSININGNSTPIWMDGKFINGEFGIGTSVFDPDITPVAGTFSDNPLIPNPNIGTVSWLNGTFENGVIKSFKEEGDTPGANSVIWEDGTFNNGDIIGNVMWENGTFNNGKFRSQYGDGFGTFSTGYAWRNGVYNNGKFGDPNGLISVSLNQWETTDTGPYWEVTSISNTEYTNPSWLDGRFRGGDFYGKVWNDGIFTGGNFVGTTVSFISDYVKESYPQGVNRTVDEFNFGSPLERRNYFVGDLGEWYYTETLQFLSQRINITVVDPRFNIINDSTYESWSKFDSKCVRFEPSVTDSISNVSEGWAYSPEIDIQVNKIEFPYVIKTKMITSTSSFSFLSNYSLNLSYREPDSNTWVSATAGGDSLSISSNGEDFKEGIIEVDIRSQIGRALKSGSRIRYSFDYSGSFLGSPPSIVESNTFIQVDDIRLYNNNFTSKALKPDVFVMNFSEDSNTNWFGMWRNGSVVQDDASTSNTQELIQLTNKNRAIKQYKEEPNQNIKFENALWVDGTFNSPGRFINSVWLNGEFRNGNFISSAFNPYVPRWDFDEPGGSKNSANPGYYEYQLFDDECVWRSGVLENSLFDISTWERGAFKSGTMSGGRWVDGVAKYINAYNSIWEGGIWKNGNWYGSNYERDTLYDVITSTSGAGLTFVSQLNRLKNNLNKDTLFKNADRLQSNHIFGGSIIQATVDSSFDFSNYEYADNLSYSGVTVSNNDYVKFVDDINSVNNTFGTSSNNILESYVLYDLNFDNHFFGYSATSSLFKSGVGSIDVMSATNGIDANFGNGAFIKGVWENGAWNNGPRDKNPYYKNGFAINATFSVNGTQSDSTTIYANDGIFDSVSNFFEVSPNVWEVELFTRDSLSLDNFNISDIISVGNIVGVSVNGDRKLFNDSYRIISKNELNNTLSFRIKTTFPLRAIERDSIYHKIFVTNRVWEDGIFHNGTFEGVWNNGTFEGYPEITQMRDTYWIDGIFDGGKFEADNKQYSNLTLMVQDTSGTFSTSLIQNARILTGNEESFFSKYRTWMDLNYTDEVYDQIWSNDSAIPQFYETTPDILSSITNIWTGSTDATRQNRDFNLGTKFKSFDDIILSDPRGSTQSGDLDGIFPPETLEDRGYNFFKTIVFTNSIETLELSPTQSKFVGNDGLSPIDSMDIDTSNSPLNATFSATATYSIGHNNLSKFGRFRYWETSFDVLEKVTGDYIFQFPYNPIISPVPNIEDFYEAGKTVKVYSWNFPQNNPILQLRGTASSFEGVIDNISFTEIDQIPFHNYFGGTFSNIDLSIQEPKQSISEFIEIEETDANFIDKK